jgi:hypothetical protein
MSEERKPKFAEERTLYRIGSIEGKTIDGRYQREYHESSFNGKKTYVRMKPRPNVCYIVKQFLEWQKNNAYTLQELYEILKIDERMTFNEFKKHMKFAAFKRVVDRWQEREDGTNIAKNKRMTTYVNKNEFCIFEEDGMVYYADASNIKKFEK